jgi:hypothetical protein
MADCDPMTAQRAAACALCDRIDARLKAYSDSENCDFSRLRTRTWGRLFKGIRVDGDQLPRRLVLDLDAERGCDVCRRSPTIAAAIHRLKRGGRAGSATVFAHACLRERALVGHKGARRLLERASKEVANRLFSRGAIPLKAVFDVPVGEFNEPRQNRLRSEVLRARVDSVPSRTRLGAICANAIDVLAPFYAVPGRPTFEDKEKGVNLTAKHPPALLQDVAELLIMWRPGEFDGLNGEKVRRALRP